MSTKVTPPQPSGLPLRGIAMIIIAVAVLLLAWGVYSMTNSGTNTAQEEVTVAETSANKPAAHASAAPAAPATPATSAANSPAATASAAPSQPAAPAATSGATPKVFALNNSTVQGLANRVAEDLKSKGFADVESGNFPDEVLPKSVAFFTPGNADEEAAARKIADQLKITAQPRIDALKDKPAGVILVIAEDLNR